MDSTGIYGHEKTADRTVCRFLCPQNNKMHAPRTFYYHELYSQVGKANWRNKLYFFSKLYSQLAFKK